MAKDMGSVQRAKVTEALALMGITEPESVMVVHIEEGVITVTRVVKDLSCNVCFETHTHDEKRYLSD